MARLRLAPTPSGYLHLGNGVNFALAAELAARLGGRLSLRVDDLDRARVRQAYLADLSDTLHWLFPDAAAGLLRDARYQSRHAGAYARALDGLRQNRLVYACACTRRDIRDRQANLGQAFDVNAYPGTCRERGLPLSRPGVAWRLRSPGGHGDFVVRQRDGTPAYQLASVVDDVDMGITHVVRGEDLRASTAMQQVLAKALAVAEPRYAAFAAVRVHHHGLVRDPSGVKLSKSAGSTSLRAWREAGRQPGDVFAVAREVSAAIPSGERSAQWP